MSKFTKEQLIDIRDDDIYACNSTEREQQLAVELLIEREKNDLLNYDLMKARASFQRAKDSRNRNRKWFLAERKVYQELKCKLLALGQ